MKLKFKVNGAGLKALAMQHGEKAGFGLGVLMLVLFIWSATKTTVLGPDKQPKPLEDSAAKTDQHILNSKWDPKAKGIEVVDYVSRAKRDPLNDKDYRLGVFLNKPLWESKVKRPDPKMLPVEELLATAGVGVFALAPPEDEEPLPGKKPKRGMQGGPDMAGMPGMPPAAGPKGARKGKADEVAAAPPKRKRPNRHQEPEEPKGTRVTAKSILKGYSWVVVTGLIPVRKQEAEFEEAFRNVILSDPDMDIPEYLGLKIERAEVKGDPNALNWQAAKEIKTKELQDFMKTWQTEAREVIDDAYIDPIYTMPLAPLVGVDWDPAVVGHSKIPEAPKRNARKAKVQVEEDEGEEEGGGLAAQRKRPNNFGAADPVKERRKHARGGASRGQPQTDFTLFRFIDNMVEPGKKYRYRVKLRLSNPNLGKAEKYLKNPESHAQKYLYSAWSEATPVVTIPPDIDIYAGSVVKASAKEPLMKAMVSRLDHERGMKLHAEDTFTRGSLINIRKTVTLDGPDGEPMEIANAVLDSNSVVVDIQGGKPFKGPKSPTAPGEMVVLRADGSLTLHDELDDETTYRTILPNENEPVLDDGGGILSDDPYKKLPKGKDGPPKKSRLETLKSEAKKKKKSQ